MPFVACFDAAGHESEFDRNVKLAAANEEMVGTCFERNRTIFLSGRGLRGLRGEPDRAGVPNAVRRVQRVAASTTLRAARRSRSREIAPRAARASCGRGDRLTVESIDTDFAAG